MTHLPLFANLQGLSGESARLSRLQVAYERYRTAKEELEDAAKTLELALHDATSQNNPLTRRAR